MHCNKEVTRSTHCSLTPRQVPLPDRAQFIEQSVPIVTPFLKTTCYVAKDKDRIDELTRHKGPI